MSGLLFVFSGPSGAGKNTIMKEVMQREASLTQLPTATTRPIRDNEQHGREHEFLSETEIRQRILDKKLIEWQIIHDKGIYGVPRATIQDGIRAGKTLIADVDVLGAMQLKQEFGNHIKLIFVKAPDMATLENRLRNRVDFSDEEDLQARLRRADFEMGFADQYDHQLINRDGELEAVVQDALQIIHKDLENAPPIDEAHFGWNPDNIHQSVTGVVLQNGQVLLHHKAFPTVLMPDHSEELPFDVIRAELEHALDRDIFPSRPDAIFSKVDSSFEPPQIVLSTKLNDRIEKYFYYVLQIEPTLTDLPADWTWVAIDDLQINPALHNIVREAALLMNLE